MWFYDDKPYKGTVPADLQDDESSDSAGYADWVTDCLFAVFVIALTSALATIARPLVERLQ